LYDKCSYASRDRGWVVGIHTVSDQGSRDPRYFFSLKTDRARQVTTINAHRSYLPGQWVYLAATYDGRQMKLYMNGAQVATSGEQVGGIFSPLTQKCKVLMLGGSALNHNYRGYVEHFSLWKVARTQREIVLDMGTRGPQGPLPQLLLQENWDNVKRAWSPMKDGSSPHVEVSGAPGFLLDTSLEPPMCGQTLCDSPQVIANYNQLPRLRRPKVVRYRVVNLHDDGRENPTVSRQQIDFQHRQLAEAFKNYNISWELEVLEVSNSSLRRRLILANCDISKIGDENCDPECNHTLTGHDGGDCRHLRHPALAKKQENGVCDMDCNYERFNFDGGECCGIVLNPSFYGIPGHTHTMIHEIGHSLGLYHIFRGISEIQSCSDPCMETEPSYETGDLCSDTNPAPKHKFCGDPGPGNDTCGFHSFFNTPYNNFMSYADDDCTDSFTPNQVARMHCYLDLVYQGWQPSRKPAPIALAPQVVSHTADSVMLEWFPPIDGHFFERELGSACDLCLEGRFLVQYAFNASSPMPCGPSGHWSPREAEGHPDVEQPCKSSVRTWSPNSAVNPHTIPPACPEPQGCHLDLRFRYPLVPESLTVWVTFVSTDWDSSGAVNDIKLLGVNGNNISLGPQDIFCDVPLTIKLRDVGEEVYGVQIYTLDEHLEIDAAMLTSVADSPLCLECKPLRYKVVRDPPLQVDVASTLHFGRRFTDTVYEVTSVEPHIFYVQTTWIGNVLRTEKNNSSGVRHLVSNIRHNLCSVCLKICAKPVINRNQVLEETFNLFKRQNHFQTLYQHFLLQGRQLTCTLQANPCPFIDSEMKNIFPRNLLETWAGPGSVIHSFWLVEYWSGLPFPPPGDLPDQGSEPVSPALAGSFVTSEPPGKPVGMCYRLFSCTRGHNYSKNGSALTLPIGCIKHEFSLLSLCLIFRCISFISPCLTLTDPLFGAHTIEITHLWISLMHYLAFKPGCHSSVSSTDSKAECRIRRSDSQASTQGPCCQDPPRKGGILPGKFHGQRSLVGSGARGHKESDTTEATQHACTLRTCETTCFHHPSILKVLSSVLKGPLGGINHSLMGFNTSQTPLHCASCRAMPSTGPRTDCCFTQSCLTLRDPMDCSLPGSSVHGIFQARVLEWDAIAFSSGPREGRPCPQSHTALDGRMGT
ncbi:hypothetical protein FD754_016356, partial [Muntiacus muntjak]